MSESPYFDRRSPWCQMPISCGGCGTGGRTESRGVVSRRATPLEPLRAPAESGRLAPTGERGPAAVADALDASRERRSHAARSESPATKPNTPTNTTTPATISSHLRVELLTNQGVLRCLGFGRRIG